MVATLSADVVRSTSLRTDELLALRKGLLDLFDKLGGEYPGYWARVIRGDGIECFIPDYHDSLRIAVLIKLLVKMSVGEYNCSEKLRRHGVRFSIGIGSLRYEGREEDIIDGRAIYISGRNLDDISESNDVYSSIEVDGIPGNENRFLDSYVAMISHMVDSYSVKMTEVVFYKLLGYREHEISQRLGIYQSSVNTRATNAQWRLLNRAIKNFEKLNWD